MPRRVIIRDDESRGGVGSVRGFGVELFARSQGLGRACLATGLRCLPPVDLRFDASHDLSRSAKQHFLSASRAAVCCDMSTLGSHARSCRRLGVNLAIFCACMCRVLSRRGMAWSIENPSSSAVWSFGPISDLAGLPRVSAACQQCDVGDVRLRRGFPEGYSASH